MILSSSLVKEFAKLATAQDTSTKTETVNATVSSVCDSTVNVVIDGASMATPADTTVDVSVGDRVVVQIQDHTATVTGSTSNTAVSSSTLSETVETINNKFESLYADEVFAKSVVAQAISADDITSKNIVTQALTADDATIKNLVTDNIEVGSINGNVIKNSYILAKALSNEAVETILGNKVTYSAIEPRYPEEGDIWYKTIVAEDESVSEILYVYQNGLWILEDLDYSLLKANSITAQEIYVKDLYALDATIGGFEITETSISHNVTYEAMPGDVESYTSEELEGLTAEEIESKHVGRIQRTMGEQSVYIGEDAIALGTKFNVTNEGILTAVEANISGSITAQSGYIGSESLGWHIASSSMYNYTNANNNISHDANNPVYVPTYYHYFLQAPDGHNSTNMLATRQTISSPSSGSSSKDWTWASDTNWFYTSYIAYNGEFSFKYVTDHYNDGAPRQYVDFRFDDGALSIASRYRDANGNVATIPKGVTQTSYPAFRANSQYTYGSDVRQYTDYGCNGILYRGQPIITFEDSSTGGTERLIHFKNPIDINDTSIRGYNGTVTLVDADIDNAQVCFGPPEGQTGQYNTTKLRGASVRIYSSGGGVYLGADGSVAITSDESLKTLSDIDTRYEVFFNNLNPVAYKYKVGHRQHIGFGAQSVEKALKDSSITSDEFAGLVIQENVDIDSDEKLSPDGQTHFDKLYSLRYEEFIALNTYMIQKALKRIEELEQKITELTS